MLRMPLCLRRAARRISAAGLLLIAAGLGTSCGTMSSRLVSDPAPAIGRLQHGGNLHAEVDQLAQPLVARGEVDGLAVGVLLPDGRTRFFGYGAATAPHDPRPPAGDTLFQIGSLSKLFVAAVLARLVADGELRYTDTVRDLLPANVPVSPAAAQLTLYELATHTGGLPRERLTFTQLRHFFTYLFTGRNLYRYVTTPWLYRYLRTCRLPLKAQRHYEYSNLGIGLLTHLMEVKTGRPFAALVAEEICQPLGLKDTVVALNPEQQQRLAMGHAGEQPRFLRRHTPVPPWEMGDILRGSAGMYSTVNDLLIFARASLGQLHHPLEPVLASLQEVQLRTPDEDVAFTWLINHFENGQRRLVYKYGIVAGYSAYIGLNADSQTAVVVLSNTFSWHEKVGHNLLLRLAGAYAAPAMQQAQHRGSAEGGVRE